MVLTAIGGTFELPMQLVLDYSHKTLKGRSGRWEVVHLKSAIDILCQWLELQS